MKYFSQPKKLRPCRWKVKKWLRVLFMLAVKGKIRPYIFRQERKVEESRKRGKKSSSNNPEQKENVRKFIGVSLGLRMHSIEWNSFCATFKMNVEIFLLFHGNLQSLFHACDRLKIYAVDLWSCTFGSSLKSFCCDFFHRIGKYGKERFMFNTPRLWCEIVHCFTQSFIIIYQPPVSTPKPSSAD